MVALEGGHGDDDQPHSMLRKSPFRRFKLRSIRTCTMMTAWSHIVHVAHVFCEAISSPPPVKLGVFACLFGEQKTRPLRLLRGRMGSITDPTVSLRLRCPWEAIDRIPSSHLCRVFDPDTSRDNACQIPAPTNRAKAGWVRRNHPSRRRLPQPVCAMGPADCEACHTGES